MEKQTKILLGLGAIIVVYLILKPKKVAAKSKSDMSNIEQDTLNAELERLKYLSMQNKPCAPADLGCREEGSIEMYERLRVDPKFYDINYLNSILK